VQAEQSIYEAVDLILINNLDIMPVYEGKTLVGVIRPLDILEFIRLKYLDVNIDQSPAVRFAEFDSAKGKLTPL